MKSKVKKEKQDNFSVAMIGLFFLASSAFFCWYLIYEDHLNLNGEGQSDFSSVHKANELDSVNDHLKAVSDKMELDRLKTLVANMKLSNGSSIETSGPLPKVDTQPIVELSGDPRVEQMATDFGRNNEIKKKHQDPRSLVYDSVIEDRRLQKFKEQNRRQQAEEFVAKARKDGWIVKLDQNFKIKSYQRIEDTGEHSKELDYKGFEVIPK